MWGPPPDGSGPIIVVGYSESRVRDVFDGCHIAAVVDNRINADTEEQGQRAWLCQAVRDSCDAAWPRLVHLSG